MKAAIYSRKSKYTGKGESVENQIQLCKEHGMKYLGLGEEDFIIYEDEGFSGGNTKRPKFQKMLKDSKHKNFDVLICYRLDRISRNVSDFSQLIKDLNKYNVHFVSIREQFDTTTPMGRAMMYIASVFSQLERETIAERIKDNMVQLAKTGRWLGGVPPTGYRSEAMVLQETGEKEKKMFKLVPIPEEIALVKLIFEKYVVLKSISKVEKYLVQNNITTKNRLDFQRYSIRFILSNPVYAVADRSLFHYFMDKGYDVCSDIEEFNGINGMLGYNKTRQSKDEPGQRCREGNEWILAVGRHSGLIKSHIWIEAQELLEKNSCKSYRRVRSSTSMLSGILRCVRCGSYMRPKSVKRTNSYGDQVFYYMCELKEKSNKSRCTMANINGNILDGSVMKELVGLALKYPPIIEPWHGGELIAEEDTRNEEAELLKNKIAEADSGIQNLLKAIVKGQKDDILDMMLGNMKELHKEKESLERRLQDLENGRKALKNEGFDERQVAESLGRFDEYAWELMNVEYRRAMVRNMISKMVWDGKELAVVLHGSEDIKSTPALKNVSAGGE